MHFVRPTFAFRSNSQAQSKAKIYTANVSTAKRTFHCGSNVLLFHFLNSMNKKLRRKPLKAKQISPLLTFPMPKIQFFIVYQYFRCLFVNQWNSQMQWKYSNLQLFYCSLTVYMYLQCGVIPALLIPVIYTVSLSG